MCCLVLSSAVLMTSCRDIADDDHYAQPSWLKGNAWQVMEADGNYTSMLKAVELTGYKPIVSGQSILTVMAPDDTAWQSYLQQQGYSSVDDMFSKNPTELKKTVGYHLMYYAYDWDKLVNFRPNEGDGASTDQKSENAGLWYKHRTRSQDEMDKNAFGKYNVLPQKVWWYHYERYLPVLSNKFFETLGIDAKTNYEYFFPNSSWDVVGNGFQVANASVQDKQSFVTDNGYLYHINQVVRPLETIYQTLKSNPNYSQYIELYDSYSEFQDIDVETKQNLNPSKNDPPIVIITHGSLPNIACEWPVTDYRQVATLERAAYNIFAPSNQAISRFFQNYWTADGGYLSLNDLDPLILRYFIMQSFADTMEPVFPEEIRDGKVQTAFGTPISINPDQVTDRLFCENGVVYGMDNMDAPAIFSAVVGPAFKDTTYQCYLYTLDKSDLVLSLASSKSEFVTLIPSNKQYNQNEPAMRLNTTSAGRLLEVYSDVDGNYATMGQGQAEGIVNMHTAPNINALQTTGTQVVKTNIAFNYWFVHDGQITTNARFNEQLNPAYEGTPFVAFTEITNNGQPWANGRAYAYDSKDLFVEASGDGLEHLLCVGNDKNYEYYLFAQLLQKAGLVDTKTSTMPSLASLDNRLVVFAPTNEAIRTNLSKIPGTAKLTIAADGTLSGTPTSAQKSELANHLRNYFVSSLMNTIDNYPYPGSTFNGTYLAMSGENLYVQSSADAISVRLANGTSVAVSNKFFALPFAYNDGCLQFIDGILE